MHVLEVRLSIITRTKIINVNVNPTVTVSFYLYSEQVTTVMSAANQNTAKDKRNTK